MKQRISKIAESIDRLTLRERLMLLAAALFALGGLWQAVLAAPLAARERAANENVTSLRERLGELDASLAAVAAGASEGVPERLERVRSLRESVRARDEQLRVLTSDLVDPTEMRRVLEELLRRQDGLQLQSAVNLPARAVLEDEDSSAESTAAEPAPHSDAPKLYRHSLILTLRGRYLDCLRYLEAVEALPWHIYWSRIELSTDEYPVNDITIELTTLSLDEEWIGV